MCKHFYTLSCIIYLLAILGLSIIGIYFVLPDDNKKYLSIPFSMVSLISFIGIIGNIGVICYNCNYKFPNITPSLVIPLRIAPLRQLEPAVIIPESNIIEDHIIVINPDNSYAIVK